MAWNEHESLIALVQVNIAGSKEKVDARQGSLMIKNYYFILKDNSRFSTQKNHDFESIKLAMLFKYTARAIFWHIQEFLPCLVIYSIRLNML